MPKLFKWDIGALFPTKTDEWLEVLESIGKHPNLCHFSLLRLSISVSTKAFVVVIVFVFCSHYSDEMSKRSQVVGNNAPIREAPPP